MTLDDEDVEVAEVTTVPFVVTVDARLEPCNTVLEFGVLEDLVELEVAITLDAPLMVPNPLGEVEMVRVVETEG